MKKQFQFLKLLLPALLIIFSLSSYAQEFTLTTTNANIISSKVPIDFPGLSGNSHGIIVATPLGNTKILNPHPTGAWYYSGKWNLFNTDHAAMVPGLTYKVQYFLTPGPHQFLHIITQQNLESEGSYIDNPALNNHPNVQLSIFQNHAPDDRTAYSLNKFEAKAEYNSATGKWHIKNINGEMLYKNSAYNIVISTGQTDDKKKPTIPPESPSTKTNVKDSTSTNSPSTQLPSVVLMTPGTLPVIKNKTTKSIQLSFDNLNDFVAKGLPLSASLPIEDIDLAAMMMAKQISKSDENSLPVLLTALQTAGFTIIDENRKVLRKPLGVGRGQGLGFYDFEAVGALKLANRGVIISLEKIAGQIVKEVPQISASQFAEWMLNDLRMQADNSNNDFLRFWARLIIELSNSSAQPVDLMTASPNNINLSMLQASLLLRRLQGDIYTLKKRLQQTGMIQLPFSYRNSLVSFREEKNNLHFFTPVFLSVINNDPCNLTSDEALILDAAAVGLTTWNGWQFGQLGADKNASGYSTKLGKIGLGLQGANATLAWLKLIAAVTMLKGEIIVQKPLPLVRTKNSTPGDKRLMVARVWQEVGRKEMLNCVRPLLNVATGLDFNLPTDGPLGDVAIEWHFAGDNEIRVNNADTRNLQNFVAFKSPDGTDANPQKQVTDNLGLSKMWLFGAPKIPAVVYQKKPMEIEKKAEVFVGVTLKSSKDFIQNWIDIGGAVVGVATGGPLGLVGAAAEIGYRVPYVVAKATIPVIDHEPCDGQWVGTVTYTQIRTYKNKITFPAKIPANSGGTGYFGGYTSTDETITLSGTATVNSKNGQNSLTNSSADEITIQESFHSSAGYCNKKMGVRKNSSYGTDVRNASGNTQGTTTVYIYFNKDNYTITLKPLNVKATLQSSSQSSHSGCNPGGDSNSSSSIAEYGASDITGKASFGDDQNTLSGSTTTTSNINKGGNTVTTITWNLKRCNQ